MLPVAADPALAPAGASRVWAMPAPAGEHVIDYDIAPDGGTVPGHPREARGIDRADADRGPQLARGAADALQIVAVAGGPVDHPLHVVSHLARQAFEQRADRAQRPFERGDAIGDLEQAGRPRVAAPLVFGKRRRRAVDDRLGQQLGIAKRVGDAVGRQRILEVSRVADERPSLAPALTEVPGAAGEAGQRPFADGRGPTARALARSPAERAGMPAKRPAAIMSAQRAAGTPANTSVSPSFVGITPAAPVVP